MNSVGGELMGWKRFFALALVVLFLGMTVSGASATASFVNATVNSTVTVPQEFSPEKGPRDEVQPQAVPGIVLVIGAILVDNALSLAIEHYVSPEAAMAYDALSTILAPDPTDIVRGGKWGIKILAKDGDEISRFSMGIVKDYLGHKIMVREFTKVSKENARWVVNELGKQYLEEIGEKYVKRRGMDFDEVVDSLKRIRKWLTNKNAFKEVIRRDWDVEKLEEVLNDASSVKHGGSKLIGAINRDLKKKKTLGPLYEAEVVSYLKKNGWTIKEVEKEIRDASGRTLTEVDIITKKGSDIVLIECKRNAHKISEEQLAKYAEYAINNGIRKIEVYFSEGADSPASYYYYKYRLPKEIKSKFGVDVEVFYLASEFD
ncbi:PDDEXK family nuclease [Thermococcus thermotolerans]|uniref:hypothetical protein n=1 Tax=Thermococcus thermotolerans TaxID=2969672 RepID=UPI0021584F6D|nr:hypothetical protein [Thermococcus thermotolerans]